MQLEVDDHGLRHARFWSPQGKELSPMLYPKRYIERGSSGYHIRVENWELDPRWNSWTDNGWQYDMEYSEAKGYGCYEILEFVLGQEPTACIYI